VKGAIVEGIFILQWKLEQQHPPVERSRQWTQSSIVEGGQRKMANVNATATQTIRRARRVISQAKRKGEELATELTKKPAVRQARKKVARVRGQAAALAVKVTDKVTGRARKRRRAKVAAAVVGAAAVATAAGISMTRKRKR
jgi:hypothetical protein